MASFETRLEDFIEDAGWNIDYQDGQVVSNWGEVFSVEIVPNEECSGLFGLTYLREKKIELRQPCDGYLDGKVADSEEELMAHVLAHEVGHTDAYPVSIVMEASIISFGLIGCLMSKSPRPAAYAVLGLMASKLVLDEMMAEGCASVLHDSPFFYSYYFYGE